MEALEVTLGKQKQKQLILLKKMIINYQNIWHKIAM